MARNGIGTATSEFFIVLEGAAELDTGCGRQPDGHGFAAFGRVISGMDVVRAVFVMATMSGGDFAGELARPVAITTVRRLPD